MPTTFISRKTARSALAALFTSNGKWQAVFGYLPTDAQLLEQSPVLVILSEGTDQEMSGQFVNKATYSFVCTTWVASPEIGSFTRANAEDLLDDLDKEFRQTIRNSPTIDSGKAIVTFAGTTSQVSTIADNGGGLWRTENYTLNVIYPSGG